MASREIGKYVIIKFMNTLIKDSLKVIIVSVVVLLSVYLVLAQGGWAEPTLAPPGGNAAAPLNTGSTGQSKSGGLILNTGGAINGLIVSSGKVGIGTANPGSPLHVQGQSVQIGDGSVNLGAALKLLGSNVNKNWMVSNQMTLGGFEIVPSTLIGGSTFTTPAFVILDNGKVGIGTSNPGEKLQVVGGNIAVDNLTGIGWGNRNAQLIGTDASGASYLRFDTGGTEKMRLINNGNVGIGTANPTKKLDVSGDVNLTGDLYTSGIKSLMFGGIYYSDTGSGSCLSANPATGSCSCPAGFTASSYHVYQAESINCGWTAGYTALVPCYGRFVSINQCWK